MLSMYLIVASVLGVLALLLGLISIIADTAARWRFEDELAELSNWNMSLHDGWRSKATRRAFEHHKRGCRRCRGDLFGSHDFVLPEQVTAHTLQELRSRKLLKQS